MAKQTINIGNRYDDPTADKTRDAFDMVNDNFDELYADKTLSLPIGTWNMDTGASKDVSYTVPNGYQVVNMNCQIIADDLSNGYQLSYAGHINYIAGANKFTLTRETSGIFDGVSYDDGTMNRGFVTFMIVPSV